MKLRKLNSDISIMEIETESMKKVINSNGKSFNCIESSRHSKLNKSSEGCKSKDLSCHYVYKDRLETGSYNERVDEEDYMYESKQLQQRIRDQNNDVFHKSDLNKTSNMETTQYATSHILTKDSVAGAMTQSFSQKAMINNEDNIKSKGKNKSLLRNVDSNWSCKNGCIIM